MRVLTLALGSWPLCIVRAPNFVPHAAFMPSPITALILSLMLFLTLSIMLSTSPYQQQVPLH